MLKRFFACLKALIAAEPKMLDDPERLLDDAQTKMREAQFLHRKRAVEAVTAKNNFQQLCADTRKRIDALTEKANEAERSGDGEKAEKLRRDCARHEEALIMMETQLVRAMELCEQVKRALECEEEKVRQKTREALELKAQWKRAQIPNSPNYFRPNKADPMLWWVAAAYLALVLICFFFMWLIDPHARK